MQQRCACGHTTRARAVRADADSLWPGVAISEQRLLGPRLAATVVYLCLRMRLPRRKVSELLLELFGLQLSAALIDQTVHQAARSVAPLEHELAQQLEQAVLLHADETSWAESGQALWLWVLCCCHTVLYVIGSRTKEMLDNALSTAFAGTPSPMPNWSSGCASSASSIATHRTKRCATWRASSSMTGRSSCARSTIPGCR